MSHLHIDFETRSTVDIRKAGADVYARHETTEVLCMGWAIDDEPVQIWHPELGVEPLSPVFEAIRRDNTAIAHNAPFELAVWEYCFRRQLFYQNIDCPKLPATQIQCTMAMAYAMALPGSLDKAAQALGLDVSKDMSGHRIMLQLAQPRRIEEDGTVVWWDDPVKFEKLYEYCKQDIEVERQLFKRLMRLSPREQAVWQLDYTINQRGVAVDLPAVRSAIELVKLEKKRLDAEMREVTGGGVSTCTATAQLTDWLRSEGVEVDGVAKADVLALLQKVDLPDRCRSALLLRQEAAKSSTAKLEAMLSSSCDDSRIRGIFQYHGAGTGRWAGRRIQPQNFPRPKLSQDEIEEVFGILRSVS